MLRFEAGADDLLRSRFAISPLFELDHLLRGLSGISPHRLPTAWCARLMPVFKRLRAETDLARSSHCKAAATDPISRRRRRAVLPRPSRTT